MLGLWGGLMNKSQRVSRVFNWPAFFAAIPLLAAVYDAYGVASYALTQQSSIDWIKAFVSELMPRLVLALIVALPVYGLASASRMLVLRLQRASDAAQAARSQVAVPRPKWEARS
jgi:cell shape-determining protein MreD